MRLDRPEEGVPTTRGLSQTTTAQPTTERTRPTTERKRPTISDLSLGTSPELADAWITWLRTFRWDWWATLAFGKPHGPSAAVHAVTEWLKPLPDSYAAIGLQRGPIADRLHVHVMIGGTGRHPLKATFLRGSWRRGDLQLDGYHPARGAIEYLTRQASEIEIIGSPRPYRPHKR